MKKLLVTLVVTVPLLGGCAALQRLDDAFQVLTSSSVTPQEVVIAVNAFDTLEVSATNYLKLPKCGATASAACRDPAVTAKLIPAIRAGRVARDNLITFAKTHPGQLGSQGLYDALQTAMSTISAVVATVNGGK